MVTGTHAPLLERDAQLDQLSGALAAAERGAGQLVIIEGPAGIGKTGLIGAARAVAAERGMRVLGARAHELEREFTFGVVRQLYEPALSSAEEAERERWLGGAARLVPMLGEDAATVAPDQADARFARLHGLYWLFANIAAERPVVALVDDAQWADEPSLGFLGFLGRRVEELPLTLIVATRPAGARAAPLLHGLTSDPSALHVRLPALSRDAVAEWIRSETGAGPDDAFSAACHEVTNGFPFYVRELLHEIRSEGLAPRAEAAERVRELGPEGVASVLLLRLSKAPAAAAALAQALAVLDGSSELTVAAGLAGIDQAEAAGAFSVLIELDVLDRGPLPQFAHPIIKAAVLGELAPDRVAADHRRAAQLLHGAGAPAEQVALHLLAADRVDDDWAVEALRAAARDALSHGGAGTAARCLERAIAAAPTSVRADLLADLGHAEALAGLPTAVPHLLEAIELAGSPDAAARVSLDLCRLLKFAGQPMTAIDVLEAALSLGQSDRNLESSLESELLSLGYVSMAARDRLRPRLQALSEPETDAWSGRDALVLAGMALDTVGASGPAARAVALARRAVAISHTSIERDDSTALGIAAQALGLCDEFEEAESILDGLSKMTSGQGWIGGYSSILSVLSMLAYRRGALSVAESRAVEPLSLPRDVHGIQTFVAFSEAARNLIAVERGDPQEIRRLLGELSESGAVAGASGALLHSRGRLRAAAGDPRGAVAELRAAGEYERSWGYASPAMIWWRSDAALALAELGEPAEAERLAEEELELARRLGAPRALGIALRAAGRIAGGKTGLGMLEEAAEVLRGSGAELEYARVLTDLGADLRRARRAKDAREPLRQGYELARRCGAGALAERAFQELLSAGARPRRVALSGVESLTPSERRVADLAGGGMTNREIAQALFVTEKTVETHLGHVYTKLGIASRSELPSGLGVGDGSTSDGTPGT